MPRIRSCRGGAGEGEARRRPRRSCHPPRARPLALPPTLARNATQGGGGKGLDPSQEAALRRKAAALGVKISPFMRHHARGGGGGV